MCVTECFLLLIVENPLLHDSREFLSSCYPCYYILYIYKKLQKLRDLSLWLKTKVGREYWVRAYHWRRGHDTLGHLQVRILNLGDISTEALIPRG